MKKNKEFKEEKMLNLSPAFDDNFTTIVLSSSDYYSTYAMVTIMSIIKNSNSNRNYDILVLNNNISEDHCAQINSLGDGYTNISVRTLNIKKFTKKLNFYINGARISEETYYGLLSSWVLPDYKKLILMDCDMIVCEDISKVENLDISNVLCAGVRDIIWEGFLRDPNNDYYSYARKIGLENPFEVFNGGFIYLNCENFRSKYKLKDIEKQINTYKYRTVDQDIFNILTHDSHLYLDQKWNHMVRVPGYIDIAFKNLTEESRKEFLDAEDSPYVIHYAGDAKPWRDATVPYGNEFWKVIRGTDIYEQVLIKGIVESLDSKKVMSIDEVKIQEMIRYELSFKGKLGRLLRRYFPAGTKRGYFMDRLYRWKHRND